MVKFLKVPEFVNLSGERAIEALQQLVKDFEKQKGKELTEKQAEALIKVANQLIWSIKAETYQGALDKRIKGRRFGFLMRKPSSLDDDIHP
jgi:phage regulator Rha-like protein